MSEFRVNEHLSLRLEEGKTNVYVNNERFRQCKFLLLNIEVDEIKTFDEIRSIDEASEKLDNTLEANQEQSSSEVIIPPEVEFWGHCSNLQVWAENRYDTRLLHRNLAFPLLKKLTEVGDPLAKGVFKEEIAKRLSSGEQNVIGFLINGRYIPYLDETELEACFYSMPNLFKELFEKLKNEKDLNKDLYEDNLYYFVKTLKEKEKLLEKVILDRRANLLRNLIMIMSLTPVDGETIVLILELFKKLMRSSKEIQNIVKKEISYQFNNESPEVLLELMFDKLFRLLDNTSIVTLFSNETFIGNLLSLIEDDPKYIIDSLIEFFKIVYDDIDEEYINNFIKSMSNDTKAQFKEQLKERLKEYFTRKDIFWENKEDLIKMSHILLELLNK